MVSNRVVWVADLRKYKLVSHQCLSSTLYVLMLDMKTVEIGSIEFGVHVSYKFSLIALV